MIEINLKRESSITLAMQIVNFIKKEIHVCLSSLFLAKNMVLQEIA